MNGERHRDDGLPAVVSRGVGEQWWVRGKRHRDNGLPAVVDYTGEEWWVHGERHRDGGLPAVVHAGMYRGREWWVRGQRHRDGDLPAVVKDGEKQWWWRGNCHRGNGRPAMILCEGTRIWQLHGVMVSEEHAKQAVGWEERPLRVAFLSIICAEALPELPAVRPDGARLGTTSRCDRGRHMAMAHFRSRSYVSPVAAGHALTGSHGTQASGRRGVGIASWRTAYEK